MPQLYTLKGEPLSWEELHRRVDEYYAKYERDGSLKPTPPTYRSAHCKAASHRWCHQTRLGEFRCTCECHEQS